MAIKTNQTGLYIGSDIPLAPINGGTGVSNSNSNTITLGGVISTGGNLSTAGIFITSGAFSMVLTATAATNVTLPTTGTLVNTVGLGATGTWNISITGTAAGAPPTGTAGGDLTGTYPNPTIGANKIVNSYIRQSLAFSVIGNSTNATANVADISATLNGTVLRLSGTTLGFGALDLSLGGSSVTNALGVGNGGTSLNAVTTGAMLYGASASAYATLAGNFTTTKQYLSQSGNGTTPNAPAWSSIAGTDVTGAALTSANDTNVTITLGGTPSTALLRASSITMGWTGILANSRGGTGTAAAFTAGSVIFAGTSGVYSQDNSNLFYDSTNKFLGIGTTTPHGPLQFGNITSNRLITLYEVANNSTQVYAIGVQTNNFLFMVNMSTTNYTWNVGTGVGTSSVLMTLTGTGLLNLPGLTASKIVATDGSSNLSTVTSVSIAQGGTNATSQVSSGVNYYNGTSITSSTNFLYNGTSLSIFGTSNPGLLNVAATTGEAGITINGFTGSYSQIHFQINSTENWAIGNRTDTKFHFYDAIRNVDTLVIVSSGVNAVPGLVGIGTASPVNKLDINGAVAIGNSYAGVSTAPSNGLIVQGNVGIGTSTAPSPLTIGGDNVFSSPSTLLVRGVTNTNIQLQMGVNTSGTPFGSIQANNTTAINLKLNPLGGLVSTGDILQVGGTLWALNAAQIWNSLALTFYSDAQITQKGFVGQYTTAGDLTLASVGSGNFLRIGSNGALIGFWMDNNVQVNTSPNISFNTDGSINLNLVGAGVKIKEGTNATSGVATMVAGTVVVNTTKVDASSRIHLTSQNSSGTAGAVRVSARVNGTSFTITSTSTLDTSAVAWLIIEGI